jgi:DNA processing protein
MSAVTNSLKSPDLQSLTALFALESVKGFGPQKFRQLRDSGITASEVLADPSRLPIGGNRGDAFRAEIVKFGPAELGVFKDRAERQLDRANERDAHILVHGDSDYPTNLWHSNNPVPVLYVLGDLRILAKVNAVACVGSRGIEGVYEARQSEFAAAAARSGWNVVSGFAMGADSVAHRAARDANGSTVCVMPCGLDRPFPPENRQLWKELTSYPGAVMVSEFAFGTAAASLTLRKRNKTIVGLSRGVLIGQSSEKGGAMNAFRFALDQSKPVATFADDDTAATTGNRKIAQEETGTAFRSSGPDEGGWLAWLDGLSSST